VRATIQSITDSIPALVAYVGRDRRYVVVNRAYEEWLGVDRDWILGRTMDEVLGPHILSRIEPYIVRALSGESVTYEMRLAYERGARDVQANYVPDIRDGQVNGFVALITDLTERKKLEQNLREQIVSASELARISQLLVAELDLTRLVRELTQSAIHLTGAQFGEFDESFRGHAVVRSDDITADPRYRLDPPEHGVGRGGVPVRSYLAVPVVSRTGDVLGGLFFGHADPGLFAERQEALVVALASQAAVAIDNRRLFAALEKERAQAQDASRQYQFVAEIIPQLVWTNDASGALDYVNQRWTEYTGFSLEQSRERGWQGVLHPDDVTRTRSIWTRAMARADLFEVTARVRRASDGTYRWFLGRAHPLKDEDGRVLSWFGTCTDIHDQKMHEDSERLMSEASRVLATSFDLSSTLPTVASMLASWFHGYCIIDTLEETGLERAAAIHMDAGQQGLLDQMRAFAPRDDHSSPLWRAIESRAPEICNDVTDRLLTATSMSDRHLNVRRAIGTTGYIIAPMIAGGRVAGTIMIGAINGDPFEHAHLKPVQELAYRCAIAIENSRSYRNAQEANRLKDEFLAVVSHELRTPLNAMRGWMSLLRGSRLGEAERARALEVIDRNITAQTQLVEDLLDVSRMVTGSMRLHVEPVNLADVVRSAVESIAPAAAARRIQVETQFDVASGLVDGDPARLQQIVWNLLSNSVKFTPPGGSISVRLSARDGILDVTVTDTGQGITPEFLPFVFERFRQGDSTTTRQVGGLGIGLAIVRHLAELHGGTITASSEGEGRGAEFVLSLPRR
jgi:PAS domain S-box-containing protein